MWQAKKKKVFINATTPELILAQKERYTIAKTLKNYSSFLFNTSLIKKNFVAMFFSNLELSQENEGRTHLQIFFLSIPCALGIDRIYIFINLAQRV